MVHRPRVDPKKKEKMVEAIKHGAIEFIQKPFDPDQITTAIEHLMPQ